MFFLGLLVILTSCNDKNITFRGLKNGTLKYRTNVKISGGIGKEGTILKKSELSEHQIDWEINIKDTTKCEATILRIKSKIKRAGLFEYIFDTDLDTISIQSKIGGTLYSGNSQEKELALKELNFLKRMRGKSFTFTRDKNKKLQSEINKAIDLKDYPVNKNNKLLLFLIDFFNSDNMTTFFDFVFYPERGSFQKDSIYEKSFGKFRYAKKDNIEYWKNNHAEEKSCSVNSTISPRNNELIESVFYRKRILETKKNRFYSLTSLRIEEITTIPIK